MKFCPKCGAANTNECTRCSCGEDLSNVSPAYDSKTIVSSSSLEPFMSSSACKNFIWVFIILALIGAIVCAGILKSITLAILIAASFIVVAITFAALGGLLRNQEIQIELMKEQKIEFINQCKLIRQIFDEDANKKV